MNKSIKIEILHCGNVQVDRALPFREKTINPLAFAGLFRSQKNKICLPVSAYLIEHPKGLILVDTGWHTDVRTNQIQHMGYFHYTINKAELPDGQAIHEQLEQRGLKPKDLDYVILSHLHSDHVSGLKLVSEAKNILVSNLEWEDYQKHKVRYIPSMWNGVNIKTFEFKQSGYGPNGKAFDLFNDDSILFVNTPGHTNGLVSTLIKNNGKYALLFSDTGYSTKSWENMILPGTTLNKQNSIKSLDWVKTMSQKANCIKSIANHESDVLPYIIEL